MFWSSDDESSDSSDDSNSDDSESEHNSTTPTPTPTPTTQVSRTTTTTSFAKLAPRSRFLSSSESSSESDDEEFEKFYQNRENDIRTFNAERGNQTQQQKVIEPSDEDRGQLEQAQSSSMKNEDEQNDNTEKQNDDKVEPQSVTCDNSFPVIRGHCVHCGTSVPDANISYGHKGDSVVMLTLKGAQKIQSMIERRLLESKKLLLALDLDGTVVQATHPSRHAKSDLFYAAFHDMQQMKELQEAANAASKSVPEHERLEKHIHVITVGQGASANTLFIKVRPGVYSFLHTLKDHFEFHVFTHG